MVQNLVRTYKTGHGLLLRIKRLSFVTIVMNGPMLAVFLLVAHYTGTARVE